MRRPFQTLAVAGLLAVALGVAKPVSAGLQETFTEGNEAFWSENYEGAVSSYESLVELGVWDEDLFFNLGTAYARLGRLGAAVLNFERALLIDPGHGDARENLEAVRRALARRRTTRGQDADLEPPRSFWMSLLGRVKPGQVAIPFLLCWVGLFVVMGVRRLTGREVARLALLIVSLLLSGGVLATGALLGGKISYDAEVYEAIATGRGTSALREGPGERFGNAFTADEGDRLRVLDRDGEWLHLRSASGHEGWGQTDQFGELRRRD